MRILCLLDSNIAPNDRWLWDYLPNNKDEIDFVSTRSIDIYPKWGKLLTYYPSYLKMGFSAYRKLSKKEYDLVVGWEGKNGFPYAMVRRFLRQTKPPFVILAFSYRGLIRNFRAFTREVLSSVDHVSVTTEFEIKEYQKVFQLPAERFSYCPLGWYDTKLAPNIDNSKPVGRFILASGRSYRDYGTLIKAVEGLDLKLIIIARKFNLDGIQILPNIETLDLMPLQKFWGIMKQAEFVVVPLQDLPHASGDGHIVQAMSSSKAVIVTATPSAYSYVEPGKTGIIVPPNDPAAMREAILSLSNNPSQTERMGQAARQIYEEKFTFEAFAQRVDDTLLKVYHDSHK